MAKPRSSLGDRARIDRIGEASRKLAHPAGEPRPAHGDRHARGHAASPRPPSAWADRSGRSCCTSSSTSACGRSSASAPPWRCRRRSSETCCWPTRAFSNDGTSRTYAPVGYPAVADFDLGAALREALKRRSLPWRAGLFGTYDGFYTRVLRAERRRSDDDRQGARRDPSPRPHRHRHGDRNPLDGGAYARSPHRKPLPRHGRRNDASEAGRRTRSPSAKPRCSKPRSTRWSQAASDLWSSARND